MARKNQYEIGVAMDTDGVEKSIVNGIVKPLDDAADAFADLEKAANSADLDKELTKAQKATDKLDDELDDTRDALKRLGYAARDAGDDSKRGMDRAEEGVKEFGDEANSTAKEAAASFDGSAESILDMFQEVAANAFAGFGPAGALAGLAIAAGIGIAVGKFQEAAEAAEELRMKAVEYAQESRDAGVSTEAWFTGASRMIERIKELEELKSTDARWFWEKDPSQLEDWEDALQRMNRSTSEIGDVLSSSTEEVEKYRKAVERSKDATYDDIQALVERNKKDPVDGYVDKVNALNDQYKAHDELLSQLDEEISLRDQTTDSYERQKAAGLDAATAEAAAAEEKAERIASAEEAVKASVTSAYDSMRQAAADYATNEDGALDINRWLEYVNQQSGAIAAYQANLETMRLSPDQWQNLLEMPEGQRTQWVAQFAALPEDARAPFAAALNDVGSTGGSEAAVAFDDSFNPEASVDVDVSVDTGDAAAELDEAAEDRDVTIKANLTGEGTVRDGLDTLTKRRTVHVEAVLDTSQAARDLAAWRRSEANRPITITAKLVKEGAWQ
ncbi:hypothetical protein [Microbacterium sp. TPU 3598]|uniref:hypothetical protein n=1 Tax=Microbacterium sp. TPU 3598 TaxID=1938334 RepID=UPI000BBAC62C|nr:hypothetical protein [Microbacterium sp. TPU 3598]